MDPRLERPFHSHAFPRLGAVALIPLFAPFLFPDCSPNCHLQRDIWKGSGLLTVPESDCKSSPTCLYPVTRPRCTSSVLIYSFHLHCALTVYLSFLCSSPDILTNAMTQTSRLPRPMEAQSSDPTQSSHILHIIARLPIMSNMMSVL